MGVAYGGFRVAGFGDFGLRGGGGVARERETVMTTFITSIIHSDGGRVVEAYRMKVYRREIRAEGLGFRIQGVRCQVYLMRIVRGSPGPRKVPGWGVAAPMRRALFRGLGFRVKVQVLSSWCTVHVSGFRVK